MPEENVETGTEDKTNTMDLDSLKREIAEQNETRLRQFEKTILDGIKTKETKTEKKVNMGDAAEFADELAKLGIDKDVDAANALISIASKIAAKNASEVGKKVKEDVTESVEFTKKKERMEAEVASLYPDVLDRNSKLFKRTEKIFASLDPVIKETAEATTIAIKMAAAELGVSAIDLNALRAGDAVNNTNSGGGGGRMSDVMTEKQKSFGASFGIKPDVYEAKLKQVRDRQMK